MKDSIEEGEAWGAVVSNAGEPMSGSERRRREDERTRHAVWEALVREEAHYIDRDLTFAALFLLGLIGAAIMLWQVTQQAGSASWTDNFLLAGLVAFAFACAVLWVNSKAELKRV